MSTARKFIAFLVTITALVAGAIGPAVATTSTGCTPAERTDLAIGSNVVTAVSPLVCAGLTAAGQASAGTVCGTVTTDVSDVSKLIQTIIDSLPAPAPAARVLPMAAPSPVGFTYRGLTVTLPSADLAAKVQAKLSGAPPAAK